MELADSPDASTHAAFHDVALPWLKAQRVIGAAILAACVGLVSVMTTAAYLSDRRDPRTWTQLSKQAAAE